MLYESTKSMSNSTHKFLALAIALLLTVPSYGQVNRTIDGRGNNTSHPEWGAAGAPMHRLIPAAYSDGISKMAGEDRPNPREISNKLFWQSDLISGTLQLNDFVWVYGQFIDHDLTLNHDGDESAAIDVPMGDPFFDPQFRGNVRIPMHRTEPLAGTGTSTSNPRNHANDITAFLDASAVYGSAQERADWLRTFIGGKMKVSSGNLLPYNTVNRERSGVLATNAPSMDNPVGLTDRMFVAGDVRANENPLLAAVHTLFVREHNLICDELALRFPNWNDERLYQYARKMVSGMIQSITYNEWLPVMGINLPAYTGYRPTVNPGISHIFSTAVFRMGHTLLSSELQRRDNMGQEIPQGHLLLRDGFFNPDELYDIGMDAYFMGMATQLQQNMDPKVVEDVRNFLFGAPGSGGLDLAAINIQRARERGVPDFNSIREAVGLTPYTFFHQISANPDVFASLHGLYEDVNNIDAWVGMLSEGHMPNAIFGPTIMRLMEIQFRALRDGDRYFYLSDQHLLPEDRARIHDTRLRDIIHRNTSVEIPQENVFIVVNPDNLCATMPVDGTLFTEDGSPVDGIDIALNNETLSFTDVVTDGVGSFLFEGVENCLEYELTPNISSGSPLRGVTTFDLIRLQKHIINEEPLDSPYKLLAADANGSGTVTTFDIIELRKLILNIQSQLPNNRNWYFIPADYEFEDPSNPFDADFPESANIDLANSLGVEFIAVKIGDLNDSAAASFGSVTERAAEVVDVQLNYAGKSDDGFEHFYLTVEDFADVSGFQFTLDYDESVLELMEIKYGDVRELSKANFHSIPERGAITASWHQSSNSSLQDEGTLVELVFKSYDDISSACELLEINSSLTASEVYLRSRPNIRAAIGLTCNTDIIELYQNYPNPFKDITTIPFRLAEPMEATLSVYDVSGKLLYSISNDYVAGMHEVQVKRDMLNTSNNVAIYKLETKNGIIGKKMVLLD